MKSVFVLVFLFVSSLFASKENIFLDNIDDEKFSGLWYEIARTYNSFEDNCIAPSIEYIYNKKNNYTVYNRCFLQSNPKDTKEYVGDVNIYSNELGITFEKTYFWIFSKEYYLLYLDNYNSAIMSDKDFENVWIMHRQPTMKQEKLTQLVELLKQNIDVTQLIYPKQYNDGKYK